MGPSRHWKAAAVALVAAILSGCAAMAPAGRASGPTKDTLAAVAGALGPPEALIAATAMTAEQNGLSYPNEQARNPSQAVGEAGRFYRWHFDLRQERLVRDAEQRFPGGIRFWSRTMASAIWTAPADGA